MGWRTEAGPDASPSLRLWVPTRRYNELRRHILKLEPLEHVTVIVEPHFRFPLQKRLHPRPMQALLRYLSPRIAR
jgi:hypothetical protein